MVMSSEVVLIQIGLVIAYAVYFCLIGRVYQKKRKQFMDSIWTSVFVGFIIFIFTTSLVMMPLTMFKAPIDAYVTMNLVKDLFLLFLIAFNYKAWYMDWALVLDKKNIYNGIVSFIAIVSLFTAVYFMYDNTNSKYFGVHINNFYSEIDNIYNGNENLFTPLGNDLSQIQNNLFVFSSFYYWTASLMKMFNPITAQELNAIFFLLISTLVQFSIFLTMSKNVFGQKAAVNYTYATLLTAGIMYIISWIPPIVGIHYAPIFISLIILLLLDFYKQRGTSVTSLVQIGIVSLSSLFFSGIFAFMNITLLVTLIMLLLYTRKPFLHSARIYLIVILIGLSTILWFFNNVWGVIVLMASLGFAIYSSINYYSNVRQNLEIEQAAFKNRKPLLTGMVVVLLISGAIGIIVDPVGYANIIRSYFVFWFDISPAMLVLFIASLITLTLYGIFNTLAFRGNMNSIQKLSIMFAFNWLLFMNPIAIRIISVVIVENIIWSLSLMYIVSFPIFIIEMIKGGYKKYKKRELTWKELKNTLNQSEEN